MAKKQDHNVRPAGERRTKIIDMAPWSEINPQMPEGTTPRDFGIVDATRKNFVRLPFSVQRQMDQAHVAARRQRILKTGSAAPIRYSESGKPIEAPRTQYRIRTSSGMPTTGVPQGRPRGPRPLTDQGRVAAAREYLGSSKKAAGLIVTDAVVNEMSKSLGFHEETNWEYGPGGAKESQRALRKGTTEVAPPNAGRMSDKAKFEAALGILNHYRTLMGPEILPPHPRLGGGAKHPPRLSAPHPNPAVRAENERVEASARDAVARKQAEAEAAKAAAGSASPAPKAPKKKK